MFNSTTVSGGDVPSSGGFPDNDVDSFGYGIGISIGILLLITTITLASYFCTRSDLARSDHQHRSRDEHVIDVDVVEGIDEATLKSYPKLLYSQAKKLKNKKENENENNNNNNSTESCCSICLADYVGTDEIRELPECGHVFHVTCVDPWLRLRPTCPICRTSPLPTPQSTPLVEVVPLANQPSR